MSVTAPVEAEKVVGKKASNIVQFHHKQEAALRDRITQSTQAAGYPVTPEQITPPASRPLQDTPELKHANAVRVGAEPVFDREDIADIVGNAVGHIAAKSFGQEEGLLTHARTAPGHKIISLIKGRKAA